MTGNPVAGEKVALPAWHLSFPAGNPLRKGPTLSDNSVPNESTYELVPKLRRDLCTIVTTLTGCSNFVAAAVDIVYYVEHKLHVLVNSIQACVMTPPSTVAPQAWVFFRLRCGQGPCSARSRTYAAGVDLHRHPACLRATAASGRPQVLGLQRPKERNTSSTLSSGPLVACVWEKRREGRDHRM